MITPTHSNTFIKDAEACGKVAVEVITLRRPKVWRGVFQDIDEEAKYVGFLAQWAFHWAELALKHEEECETCQSHHTQE